MGNNATELAGTLYIYTGYCCWRMCLTAYYVREMSVKAGKHRILRKIPGNGV